jgi:hypothetical protein
MLGKSQFLDFIALLILLAAEHPGDLIPSGLHCDLGPQQAAVPHESVEHVLEYLCNLLQECVQIVYAANFFKILVSCLIVQDSDGQFLVQDLRRGKVTLVAT